MNLNRKKRSRDLGIKIGTFPTGRYNAITDVRGVKVGHTTLISGKGKHKPGKGPVRTGVTAILPNDRIFEKKIVASGFILNGAGEVTGLTQILEWGLLETPIALTNTHATGNVSNGIIQWMAKKYERIWNNKHVVIPVVGECDDSFLNDSVSMHVQPRHIVEALDRAKGGPVEEGSVGSGTGMVCCDFKGGIGTSSRILEIGKATYTMGVLVMSNFGVMEELRVDGFPVGRIAAKAQGQYRRRTESYGSIIVVIATDLPLSSSQIQRICKRASLGIGRAGSHAAHGSGEIIIGFSTANIISERIPMHTLTMMDDDHLGPAYRAVIEATEESIINSLVASSSMTGINDNWVPGIDLSILQRVMNQVKAIQVRAET